MRRRPRGAERARRLAWDSLGTRVAPFAGSPLDAGQEPRKRCSGEWVCPENREGSPSVLAGKLGRAALKSLSARREAPGKFLHFLTRNHLADSGGPCRAAEGPLLALGERWAASLGLVAVSPPQNVVSKPGDGGWSGAGFP